MTEHNKQQETFRQTEEASRSAVERGENIMVAQLSQAAAGFLEGIAGTLRAKTREKRG